MISITCTSCNKKLSVKESLAGKRVKCPGCGKGVTVPGAVAVAQADGSGSESGAEIQEMRTLPPVEGKTLPPRSKMEHGEKPTLPPRSKSDTTATSELAEPDHDPGLTDFLAPPETADELGRLGKYRILKVLGFGGMGVVYKAEDPKLKRSVALKAMLPALAASASAGKRFLREAQAMAAVEHDHIVRIYQVDEDRGVPFLAMEFLKGEPLDQKLKGEPVLPLAEVLRIGREVAAGLAAAHDTGLIHRDIKPANIWVEDSGRVKILDFGLARAGAEDSQLTQQGAIVGTPAYMAPEQAAGKKIDARCDLFSLGVILYRLATGEAPFQGSDTISTLMAVSTHDPEPPRALNANVPGAVSDLIMELLEKDPSKRITSAREVVRLLQRLERGDKGTASQGDEPASRQGNTARGAASRGKTGKMRDDTVKLDKTGPRPGGENSRRWLLLAAGGSALLLLGIVLFFVFRGSDPARPDPKKDLGNASVVEGSKSKEAEPPQAANSGNLVLQVDPAIQDVKIFLNDKLIAGGSFRDNKPETIPIQEGKYQLEVAKIGYETYSQSVIVKAGTATAVTARLKRLNNLETIDKQVSTWFLGNKFSNFRLDGQGQITEVSGDHAFTNIGVEKLKDLSHLKSLQFYDSKITDDGLKHLRSMTTLTKLGLVRNKVTDKGLEHLLANTELADVTIDSTLITDNGLAKLKPLAKLSSLYLGCSGNEITGEGLGHLGPKLTKLYLTSPSITEKGMEQIGTLKSLIGLGLTSENLTDAGLVHIGSLSKLELLDIGNATKVTGAGLAHLKANTKLWVLNLSSSKITDTHLERIQDLKALKRLDLDRTLINDTALKHVARIQGLAQLSLNYVPKITDAGLEHLHGMSTLKSVFITGTQATEEGLRKLKEKLPNCEIRSQ